MVDTIISTTSVKIDRANIDIYDMIMISQFEDPNVDMLILLSNLTKVYIRHSSTTSWSIAHASTIKIEGDKIDYLQSEFNKSTL